MLYSIPYEYSNKIRFQILVGLPYEYYSNKIRFQIPIDLWTCLQAIVNLVSNANSFSRKYSNNKIYFQIPVNLWTSP
jgi:hypothetical protein